MTATGTVRPGSTTGLVTELVTDEFWLRRAGTGLGGAVRAVRRRDPVPEPRLAALLVAVLRRARPAPAAAGPLRRRTGGRSAADAGPWPLPALVPLGGAISGYADILLDDADNGRAAGALTEALEDAARTALIDFREVRPGGAVERIYDHGRGPRRTVADSLCWSCPPYPWTGWWPGCPRTRPGSGSAPPGTGCGCAPLSCGPCWPRAPEVGLEFESSYPGLFLASGHGRGLRPGDAVRARRDLHGGHARAG